MAMDAYECKCKRCDLCGVRQCDPSAEGVRSYGKLTCCASCVPRAVALAYEAACTFGGGMCDRLHGGIERDMRAT